MKLPTLYRDEQVQLRLLKDGERTVLAPFPVSSELPVERWFGKEILAHESNSIRMERIKSGAVPLLFNHNAADPVGMVEDGWIKGKRLWVSPVLFDTARAKEVQAMIEGGLRNVSPGYRIHTLEGDKKDEVFTARDWEPLEVSIVPVPADSTVGIGRSQEVYEVRMLGNSASAAEQGGKTMSKTEDAAASAVAEKEKETTATAKVEVGESKRSAGALELEQGRIRAIDKLAKANNISEGVRQQWITGGAWLEQIGDDILAIHEERCKTNPQPAARLGLGPAETKRFSLLRAINACVSRDWTKAGFELECTRAVSQKLGRIPDENHFFVPFEVLERPVEAKRDLTVATAGAGGYLVQTENVGFIEMLRNRSVAFRMGARRLSGLQGSVTVPRVSAAATAYWLGTEATAITESQQTFVQMALTPKTVGAYTEISRQLILQSSPGAEGIVTDDLAQVVAIAADLGALNGSGAAGQPTGLINTSGIGAVTGASFDYADILEFQTDVAASNVIPLAGGYVTTPAVASLCMQRVKFTSTASPLWEGNIWDGTMVGFRAMSSNQMPAGDMLFGDWQELVIGEWGVLEIETNPFANFQAGIVGVRAIYSLDVGVRRPFAFSLMTSAT